MYKTNTKLKSKFKSKSKYIKKKKKNTFIVSCLVILIKSEMHNSNWPI